MAAGCTYLNVAGEKTPTQSPADGSWFLTFTRTHSVSSFCNNTNKENADHKLCTFKLEERINTVKKNMKRNNLRDKDLRI